MSYNIITQASTITRFIMVDSSITGSRYSVSLMADGSGSYFISVYNFNMSVQTTNISNFAYKFVELGMSPADASVVESIVASLLV